MASGEGKTEQLLTFRLGDEIFGVDVLKTREVLDLTTITRVPQMPDYMLGVINLRGTVVPVVDLKRKLELPGGEEDAEACIVVMEVDIGGETVVVGAVADSVREVLELEADQVEPPPRLGTSLNTDFVRGMGNRDGNFVILLDIDRVFRSAAADLASGAAGGAGIAPFVPPTAEAAHVGAGA